MRMRDVSSVRGKNNPNQTKPPKPNLWQAGLFFRPWGTVCACLRDEQRPSLSHCLSPFHVTAFPGSGSWRGLPKALGSSSAPQLCRSFSFLPEAELSAERCVPNTAGHGGGRGCIQNLCEDIPRETHCSNLRASPNGQTFVFLQDLIPSGICFLLVF